MNDIFSRSRLILGNETFEQLQSTRVILFGIGGVGSWCAESLIRTGLGHLTIVDHDVVCESNINRQLVATTQNTGLPKVDKMKERLLTLNPDAKICAVRKKYSDLTRDQFNLDEYDYTIDAIDTLSCKLDLIENALNSDTTLFSSMGAALKLDPSKIKTSSIWETDICPLARIVRKKLRQRKINGDFTCVWSDEPPLHQAQQTNTEEDLPNGSLAHITGIFGLTLTSLIVNDVITNCSK